MAKRLVVLALLLLYFFSADPSQALEIKQGKFKLILYEHKGIFSLYYLQDKEKGQYLPLLLDKDPRTSFLSISIWSSIYRLGESAEFLERTERTARGGRFIWTSKRLTVIEDFIIQENTVKIVLVLFNISGENQSVGARYLFDTYLGEKAGHHFTTDTGMAINMEAAFSVQNSPEFWLSPQQSNKGSEKIGLGMLVKSKEVTLPDRIIFANWNRLKESLWNYHLEGSRGFNDLPYWVNDSAVCQYYFPKVLKSGESRKIVLIIGKDADSLRDLPLVIAGDVPKTEVKIEEEVKEEPKTDSSASMDRYAGMLENLSAINRFITDINQKIGTSAAISATDIDSFKQTITEIEQKIKK